MPDLTSKDRDFDEIRVIVLPPPQTAAVNRLLREEKGWRLIDARVSERQVPAANGVQTEQLVVYIMGHLVPANHEGDSG